MLRWGQNPRKDKLRRGTTGPAAKHRRPRERTRTTDKTLKLNGLRIVSQLEHTEADKVATFAVTA